MDQSFLELVITFYINYAIIITAALMDLEFHLLMVVNVNWLEILHCLYCFKNNSLNYSLLAFQFIDSIIKFVIFVVSFVLSFRSK